MSTLTLKNSDPSLLDQAISKIRAGGRKVVVVAEMAVAASKPAVAPAQSAHVAVFPRQQAQHSCPTAPVARSARRQTTIYRCW